MDFALTPALEILLGVLVAFGILDALVLVRIASIQARQIETLADLEATRRQIERLSRTLVLGGTAFGAAFLLAVLVLAFF